MQYEESIGRALQWTGSSYSNDAKTASSTALTVLEECLNGRERFIEGLHHQPPERGMVCEKTLNRASAVMDVLGEAASGGEMEGVRRRFPGGFDSLCQSRTGRRVREPSSERS